MPRWRRLHQVCLPRPKAENTVQSIQGEGKMKTETREFLRRPMRLASLIQLKQSQLKELYYMLLPSGIRYDQDKVISTPEEKLAEIVAKMDEIEREIIELYRKKLTADQEVVDLIATLKKPDHINIMQMRYIERMSYKEIADATGFTEENVYKIHQSAGDKLDEIRKTLQ